MTKYFNVDVIPDCIAGDVSNNNGTVDIDAGDIIFNWTAVDVPKGSCLLKSVAAYVNAQDGSYSAGSLADYELVLAKSINGVAPPSLGNIGAAQTTGGSIRNHVIGGVRLESAAGAGTLTKLAFGVVYTSSINGGADTNIGPNIVIDLEPESGTNVGYDKLYVAGFQASARKWGTGVLLNEGNIDASAAPTNSITVDGTDATKMFSVGDQVYVHDLDTPIPGTLTEVTTNTLTFSETNNTVDIDENDELLNANPIRLKFGFER
tara:strand:- start:1079 stop:1867 length:789 start_codon:yes stop_codon:yes gene_type:complete